MIKNKTKKTEDQMMKIKEISEEQDQMINIKIKAKYQEIIRTVILG